tara:strand:- start:233 stop:481 length:249 start_codon:yes stop_codon:yes gene_type:complete
MEYKMIPCIACQNPMPELRFTKYGYKSCVECSTVGAYKAISTVNGVGDHTWNDIIIMTPEKAAEYKEEVNKTVKFDSYNVDA